MAKKKGGGGAQHDAALHLNQGHSMHTSMYTTETLNYSVQQITNNTGQFIAQGLVHPMMTVQTVQ